MGRDTTTVGHGGLGEVPSPSVSLASLSVSFLLSLCLLGGGVYGSFGIGEREEEGLRVV